MKASVLNAMLLTIYALWTATLMLTSSRRIYFTAAFFKDGYFNDGNAEGCYFNVDNYKDSYLNDSNPEGCYFNVNNYEDGYFTDDQGAVVLKV